MQTLCVLSLKKTQQSNKNPKPTHQPKLLHQQWDRKTWNQNVSIKTQNIEENNPIFFKFTNFFTKPPLQSQLILFLLGFLSNTSLGRSSAVWKPQMLLSAADSLRVTRKHRNLIQLQILSMGKKMEFVIKIHSRAGPLWVSERGKSKTLNCWDCFDRYIEIIYTTYFW